jgi:hypothetical protein
MTDPMSTPLDDVLTMMLDEYDAPSKAAVADYSRRFPDHRAELLAFAAAWAVGDALPAPAPLSARDESELEARAESFLQNALHERALAAAGAAAPSRPVTLADLASAADKRLKDVALEVGIPLPIMSELNGRGFTAASIRPGTLRLLAAALETTIRRIRSCWEGEAALAPAMAFLAKSKPLVLPQRDYAEAIAAADIPEATKRALLEEV